MKEVEGGHGGVLKRQLPVEYMGLRMGGCKAIEGGMGGLTTCAGTIRVDCRRG